MRGIKVLQAAPAGELFRSAKEGAPMAEPRWKYRPPEPGVRHLRESVCRTLLALAGPHPPEARLEVARVEPVERALRCELTDEILACFANGEAGCVSAGHATEASSGPV
jgi:hypothetical protein